MAVVNRIAGFANEMTMWRRHLHQIPELGFECHKTAAFVADQLRSFGVDEVHTGIAQTGLVAVINGAKSGPTIGLRADMDGLPIVEATEADYASDHDGKMHACGHDGHTTMLLGAAKYLAETRNFAGRVALIFQPAEEDQGGGGVMVDEGIMDRFDIAQVYAMHCAPGVPVGRFHTAPGPLMAAVDSFDIHITGKGGHGAFPQDTCDPIVAVLAIGNAIQTIVSRNHHSAQDLVVSITQIHTGTTDNVIPESAYINGTVRTFDKSVQAMVKRRLQEIVDGHAAAYNVSTELDYIVGYPATVNSVAETDIAVAAARDVAGFENVVADTPPQMGAEDFSYMLEARPGAYVFVGNGDSATWHHPEFDFNDEATPFGASYFARLVEMSLPIDGA